MERQFRFVSYFRLIISAEGWESRLNLRSGRNFFSTDFRKLRPGNHELAGIHALTTRLVTRINISFSTIDIPFRACANATRTTVV